MRIGKKFPIAIPTKKRKEENKMTRKEILNAVVTEFGFESEITVLIYKLAEEFPDSYWNNQCLEALYKAYADLQMFND